MNKIFSDNKLKAVYWFLPIFLTFFQLALTLKSLNQIRYEELAESIRNVFWFKNRLIYDGISSSTGWYWILFFIYNTFGFNLFAGKFFRVVLQLISFFCLAAVLKKYLGEKKSFVPLITIGLSPTLLYFNSLEAQYGIDLQYLPIVLFFLINLNFKNRIESNFFQIIAWSLAMLAWMSYPAFVYYLPSLAVFYLVITLKQIKNSLVQIKNWTISFLAFFAPFLLSFLFINNKITLINDPFVRSGIFRGAGVLRFDLKLFFSNLSVFLKELFISSGSYYFELRKVEFSDIYPILVIGLIIVGIIGLWQKNKHFRLPIILTLTVLLFTILVSQFSADFNPGLRRSTGAIAAIYIFYIFAWYYFSDDKLNDLRSQKNLIKLKTKDPKLKITIKNSKIYLVLMLILPLHHLLVYPLNFVHTSDLSINREVWFSQASSPLEALDQALAGLIRQDLNLECIDKNKQAVACRYQEIYAALAGACYWNKLDCYSINGFDLKTKKFIKLSPELWESYYFMH